MARKKPKPLPQAKGIRERTLGDGRKVYDPLVQIDGKQRSLGACDTRDEAVAMRFAFFQSEAAKTSRVPRDATTLAVAQLGYMCLSNEWDLDRWRARVVEMAEFADWNAVQVLPEHVQIWIDKMATTPIKTGRSAGELPTRGTLHSAISLLRRVYKWARMPARKYVTHNPVDGITIGNSTDVKPRSKRNVLDYLRENEVKQLLDAPRDKLPLEPRTKFITSVFSGARPSDVWRLRWERIDWAAESIQFTSAKTSKEEARDYVVHALPQLTAALREWWLACGRPTHGLVFPSESGEVYARGYDAGWSDKRERRHWKWEVDGEVKRNKSEEVRVTRGYRSACGIAREVPLYALRHTAASHLLLGSPLFTGGRMWSREEVQSQLGHRDSKATEFYLRSLGILGRRAALESKAALREMKKKPT
jgi:integrase